MDAPGHSPRTLDYAAPGEPGPTSHRLAQVGIVLAAGFAATVLTFFVAGAYGSIGAGELFIFSMVPVLAVGGIALVAAVIRRGVEPEGQGWPGRLHPARRPS